MIVELNEREYNVLKKALNEVRNAGYAEDAMSSVTNKEVNSDDILAKLEPCKEITDINDRLLDLIEKYLKLKSGVSRGSCSISEYDGKGSRMVLIVKMFGSTFYFYDVGQIESLIYEISDGEDDIEELLFNSCESWE